MKMTLRTLAIATSAFACAALLSPGWSQQGGVSLSINKAEAQPRVYIRSGYYTGGYVRPDWSPLVRREGLLLRWPLEWPWVLLRRLGGLRDAQRHWLPARYCDQGRRRHHVQLPVEIISLIMSGQVAVFATWPGTAAPRRRRNQLRSFLTDSHFKQPKPSLRANGSRERALDDRLREAIHRAAKRKNGLLRCARMDVDIISHTSSTSRRQASESLLYFPPKEGVGNAGCPLHPQPRVRLILVRSTRVNEHTGITRRSRTQWF